MRLTRVYVDAMLSGGMTLALPEGASRHVARVLRLGPGDTLRLFNGQGGEFGATIQSVARGVVEARIGDHHPIERESPLQLTLLQGIGRGEKMDLVLQKATELGVTAIAPVLTLRSAVKLDAAGIERKHAHWRAVVAGACEQCGRNTLPRLLPAAPLETALQSASGTLNLLLAPDIDSPSLRAMLEIRPAAVNEGVTLLVGPEGGFDEMEIRLAHAAGFMRCRLGPRTLRTETAGLAALASLQALVGDFR